MKRTLFCLLLAAALPAVARAQNYTIDRVTAKNALITPDEAGILETLAVGDSIIATFDDGSHCDFAIQKIGKTKVIIDITNCDKLYDLSPGQRFGDIPIPLTKSQQNADSRYRTKKWRLGLGIGHSLYTSKSEYSVEALNYKSSLEWAEAMSFTLEGRQLPSDAWGFMGGMNYELTRNLKKSGEEFAQIISFYGSAVYRWTDFYLPFGLNFALIDLKSTDGDSKAQGSIGLQVGAGWQFKNGFATELHSWTTRFKLVDSSSGTETDLISLTSLIVTVKYAF